MTKKLSFNDLLESFRTPDFFYTYQIKKTDSNPYEDKKDSRKSFVLKLGFTYNWLADQEDEEPDWLVCNKHPLTFYGQFLHEPTIDEFSEHIKKELVASFSKLINQYRDIQPIDVFHYIDNLGLSSYYLYTAEFINYYDYWKERFYNTRKFFEILAFPHEDESCTYFVYDQNNNPGRFPGLGKQLLYSFLEINPDA